MFDTLLGPKSVHELNDVISKVNQYIKQKNFDKAVTLYLDIHRAFDTMPDEYKKKFEHRVDIVFKELTLYMRVNEAYILAKSGSMAAFHKELDQIHDLTFELEPEVKNQRDIAVLLEFAKKNYQFFLEVYTYKANANVFKKKVKRIETLLHKKQVHRALKEYADLLIVYNKVAPILSYGKRLEFYELMKRLFKELSIQRLLLLASEKPKWQRVRVELPHGAMIQSLRKLPEPEYASFDARYDALHEFVKKGELKSAFDVYAGITKERRRGHLPRIVKEVPGLTSPKLKKKRKRRTILDQEYREKFDTDYKQLHQLLKEGDFHTAKRMLKTLK